MLRIYRDLGCYQLEANALMLTCDNLRALERIKEAADAADEALALYRHVDDTAGENLALEVIQTFKERADGLVSHGFRGLP